MKRTSSYYVVYDGTKAFVCDKETAINDNKLDIVSTHYKKEDALNKANELNVDLSNCQ